MVEGRLREAELMLRSGASDERVEQLTEVSLHDILALRAKLAVSPASRLSAGEHKLVSWSQR